MGDGVGEALYVCRVGFPACLRPADKVRTKVGTIDSLFG